MTRKRRLVISSLEKNDEFSVNFSIWDRPDNQLAHFIISGRARPKRYQDGSSGRSSMKLNDEIYRYTGGRMFHAGYMLFCLGLPPSHSCAIVWQLICMQPSNLERGLCMYLFLKHQEIYFSLMCALA